MIRAVLTPMLLLAVLIQAAFGCFARHSHEPIARTDANATVSDAADHHHGHGHSHHHGGHDHGPPPAAHFHFGGESDKEHQHEESGGDTYSYIASRTAAAPLIDFDSVGHMPFDVSDDVASSADCAVWRERTDGCGRSGWPSGQRLSLLGVWLI